MIFVIFKKFFFVFLWYFCFVFSKFLKYFFMIFLFFHRTWKNRIYAKLAENKKKCIRSTSDFVKFLSIFHHYIFLDQGGSENGFCIVRMVLNNYREISQ